MNLVTIIIHKNSENILVCIFGYSRSRNHVLSARPFNPQRTPMVFKLPWRLLPCSRVREHGRCINTIGTDGNCRCPPWAATPYLRPGTPVPKAQQDSHCQQHTYHHPDSDSDDQTFGYPFHFPHSATDPSARDAASTSWTLHRGRRATAMSCQEVQQRTVSKLEALNCENMWLYLLGGCTRTRRTAV